MEIKKALVVGLGSIGIRHLTMFNTVFPGNIDIGVLRRKSEKPFKFIRHYFTNEGDALRWKPDIVIIASPSHTHGKYIKLFQDSHILLEKPAVTESKDLEYIASADKLIQVGYNYRYHPVFKELRQFIENNNIKKLSLYHSDYLPNWHPWEDHRNSDLARDGVGLTLCHGIDLLLEIFNDLKVEKVFKGFDKSLDVNAYSCMKAHANSGNTQISWEIRADEPDVNKFMFEVEDEKGKVCYFDMNNKLYTRNDTFVEQMKIFRRKIENLKDFSDNNKREFERAKRILDICQ
tara:strand:- start:505 stop:1374 length:870 start_codon:yes stop_codon:yes gene_type:complete